MATKISYRKAIKIAEEFASSQLTMAEFRAMFDQDPAACAKFDAALKSKLAEFGYEVEVVA